ncbi:hypothetical protein PLEOSDRAFT_1086468 [Pleurotus ostreatus PC15]|uniref:C2H2-type domain-containing protein n=1 Tax=Pleurotus ostreatus (strain PC15) TaxID=1137138 RepID=A0A067N4Q7_PLEO1|nr:hypothetical protein PLEOSDRAFT_1086468 [Pleurotus ostreatus PC15]
MDSTLTGPVAFPHPRRQKPLSGRNGGPAAPRTTEPSEIISTGGKADHYGGKIAVGENANPKVKVKCTCGNMIHPSSLERHLRTHKFHNPVGGFVCDGCQARFTRKESLKRHIEKATCHQARREVGVDDDYSLPPARSSTKRKRESSGSSTKTPATPETMLHRGKIHHGTPIISLERTIQPVNQPVARSSPAASAQFEEEGEGDDDYDVYDDDDVGEDNEDDNDHDTDYDDDFNASNHDNVDEDEDQSEEDEDDLDSDVAKPPSRSIEVPELLPVVDMSINPALADFLLEYGIDEDDEPFDPLYFSTSEVALMTNPYYQNDTYIHF